MPRNSGASAPFLCTNQSDLRGYTINIFSQELYCRASLKGRWHNTTANTTENTMTYHVCVEVKGKFGSSIEYFKSNNIKELEYDLNRWYQSYRIIGITGVKR